MDTNKAKNNILQYLRLIKAVKLIRKDLADRKIDLSQANLQLTEENLKYLSLSS